jgi:putative oxidoreductase
MNLLISSNQALINVAYLLLRWMAGLILFVAGAGKVMGWFGGFGLDTTVSMFQSQMNLAPFWAYLSSYTEFIGGLLIFIGLLTRMAAFALFINMLVATVLTGTKDFFMGGAAYPCLLMICFLYILVTGPGKLSIDALIWNLNKKPVV